jgi:hypothetical protein
MLRVFSREAANTKFSHWFDPTGARTKIYRIRGEHVNHYTTDGVHIQLISKGLGLWCLTPLSNNISVIS